MTPCPGKHFPSFYRPFCRFILSPSESNFDFDHLKEAGSPDFAHFAYLDRSYQYLQLFYWHHVRQVSQIFFISNFWSNLGQIRPFYIKWHISGRVDLHGSVFMFKRSISIGVSHKSNTFPLKFFNFEILVLENGRYASPIFDEKSRLFDFEATFLEFQSLDWSHTPYYSSIKRVEAFATARRSKNFFQEIKKIKKV